ncbi:hypothetical protein ZIOFF_035357 [Zingiber officinale]|uniref:SAM domain-containing protein n=1 Tax=Zingiber officinale TaxID=94328 RepID=A0A8J5GKC9_ZINOF|nr:hypothetical protein ZIOFF_035357 [Zingiber officinale]
MDGKQSAATMAPLSTPTNPVAQLQVQFKELETGFRAWLAKQPTAVEAAVVTATSAAQGAFIGALMGSLTSDAAIPTPPPNAPGFNPQAMASLKQAQAFTGGPLVQARNFAVMTGTNAGISCVMRRIRGVEDMQSSMVAAFGSGAMFSLVSGMGGPNQALNAVTSGLFFSLVQGGIFKLISFVDDQIVHCLCWDHIGVAFIYPGALAGVLVTDIAILVSEKFSQPPAEDMFYSRTKGMLTSLGLQNYEKNFKKGLLNDATLPLLTDSALRDVKIPPGPRLLILDHIQRNPDLVKR